MFIIHVYTADQQCIYNQFFSLYEGNPVLLTSDEDVIREVMVKEFNNFTNRKVEYRTSFIVMHKYLYTKHYTVLRLFMSLSPGKCCNKIKTVISEYMLRVLSSWAPTVQLFICEYHRAPLMTNQHWFRQRLGAVRQQAIAWAHFDPALCRHIVSLCNNELMNLWYYWLLRINYGF